MIGIEAKDLRVGDDVLGIGKVTKVMRCLCGDVEFRADGDEFTRVCEPDTWLRIERTEA